jgi:hypothetical protein
LKTPLAPISEAFKVWELTSRLELKVD